MTIPIFARPGGPFTYAQLMNILAKSYALTTLDSLTVTSWLVVVASALPLPRAGHHARWLPSRWQSHPHQTLRLVTPR